jgi:3-hydroxymyristoyl/3-hydroxydecanoyl-(acyl carrier protein) dehydratase
LSRDAPRDDCSRPAPESLLDAILEHIEIGRSTDERIQAQGTLASGFAGFEGHFPGKPILAGAFQLELLQFLAQRLVPDGWVAVEVEHARFRKMLSPGDRVELEAVLRSTGKKSWTVRATLTCSGSRACQSTFHFGPPAVP